MKEFASVKLGLSTYVSANSRFPASGFPDYQQHRWVAVNDVCFHVWCLWQFTFLCFKFLNLERVVFSFGIILPFLSCSAILVCVYLYDVVLFRRSYVVSPCYIYVHFNAPSMGRKTVKFFQKSFHK